MDITPRTPQVDTAEAAELFEKLPAADQAAIVDLMRAFLRNRKLIPLCFKIALAVCRDLILVSTVTLRWVIGLYQN